LSCAIAGVFAGIVVNALSGTAFGLAAAAGIAVFAANVLMLRHYHVRRWTDAESQLAVRFPS